MLTKTVDVQETQASLRELLSLVREGTEIVLTEGPTPLARLVPIAVSPAQRVAGLHTGAIWTSEDFDEPLLFSVASVWEMQIKLQLGKLKLTLPLSEIIENQQQTNHLEILPILLPHVLAVQYLPAHHKDPFDRLLIAQANVEDVIIVSNDSMFPKYTDKVLW